MNMVLLFLAVAVAVIIFSIALQIIFKNPFLVAAIIFSVFLIVAAVTGNVAWLIATIAFTILAFLTAIITCLLCKLCNRLSDTEGVSDNNCGMCCCNNNNNNENETANAGITQDDIQDLTRALNNFTNCCCRRR